MKDGTEEQDIQSADPFQIYLLLDKMNNLETKDNKLEASLKFPPGFTPIVSLDMDVKHGDGDSFGNSKVGKLYLDVAGPNGKQTIRNGKEESANSVVSGHFKISKIPRTGGSILDMLEEMVKVGLAHKAKRDWVKELCCKYKVNYLALQETKMENMNLLCVRLCWGNLDFEYARSDSVGNSGGILCVWDPNLFCKHSPTCSDYFVMMRGVWGSTGQLVLLIAVYAPQEISKKQILWDFLQFEISKWKGDVVIMGDFNEVRFKSDRFGSFFNVHAASIFNTLIRSSGLEEVNLGGSSFTWCHKSASKMSKLDRFLVSESFLNKYPKVNAITLERFLSDHRSILLRESNVNFGPTQFQFYHHWIEMEGFCNMVEDGWKDSIGDNSNAMRNLMEKLKDLKKVIRVWNKSNTLRDSRSNLISDLELVDSRIDKGYGTMEDVKSRVDLLSKIQDIDKLKSIEMAQKTKVKWAVEGDESSSFFHVKREFYEHFNKRFCYSDPSYVRLQMSFPNTISMDQQRDIECEVSNAEIKKAVWDCGMDKAPGPDGFSFGFYRRFWYLIEKDVCDAVRYFFFINWEFSNGCNSFFIALIPKIPRANMVKDFRPISLVGSLYKIISKILANRLVGVLSDIVSEVQSALIAERQILDGPFILNEVLHWCKVKKKQALIFKVDFEKAYDSASWDFLDEVLSKFGFGDKWRKWIQAYLKTSRGSILINGVLNVLESIRSHFFNGHDYSSKKASWVKWKSVLTSKERGGLGVSSLYALNRGLLFKWIWRFYSQKSSLWSSVIRAIHGVNGRVDMISRPEECKSISVALKLGQLNLAGSFRRTPRGGVEQHQFVEMSELVKSIRLVPRSDRLRWDLDSSGDFTVASVRKQIDDSWLPRYDRKTRWVKYVPIKTNILAWKVMSDVLPTRFNISRRGVNIDSIMCSVCEKGVETTTHLFFSCCMIKEVYSLIFRCWDIPVGVFDSYDGWLSWIVSLRLPHKNKLLIEGFFHIMWWFFWSYRNKIIFEAKAPLKASLFENIVSKSYVWCRHRCKVSFSWNDWLNNPNLIIL
uniref:RNA-directed DNA polymerase, eukaryota n=1 Tax=Tanacetum cinerariifolium TaxID=118510 RepID=A0A6L2NWG0_TANCI|nr:RNA-directed DNA polymerase, eukaryota [Tanacetum cinerariifolium]